MAAVLFIVTSCGATVPSSVASDPLEDTAVDSAAFDRIGTDCSGIGDRANPADYFRDIARVDRLPSDVLIERAAAALPVNDDVMSVDHVESWPSVETIFDDGRTADADRLLADDDILLESAGLPHEVGVMIASRHSTWDDEAWIQFVVAVDDDGALAFLGDCADAFFADRLEQYVDSVHSERTMAEVFVEVAIDGAAWADFNDWDNGEGVHAPPSFDELDPMDRQLDVESTPAEVLDRLQPFAVSVTIPEEWSSIPYLSLCTLVAEGWNTCFAVEALDGTSVVPLEGYGTPGEPVEIWVTDYAAGGTSDPLGRLGSFVLGNGTTSLTVAGSTAAALDQLADDLERGIVRLDGLGG